MSTGKEGGVAPHEHVVHDFLLGRLSVDVSEEGSRRVVWYDLSDEDARLVRFADDAEASRVPDRLAGDLVDLDYGYRVYPGDYSGYESDSSHRVVDIHF